MGDISIKEQIEQSVPTLQEQFLRRGKLFSTVRALSFTGTTVEDKILIRNPSGSGVNLILFDIQIVLSLAATTPQMNQMIGYLYRGPTITANGTSLTPRNMKSGQSDTVQSNWYSSPTISARGVLITGADGINATARIPVTILEPNNDYLISVQVNDSANGGYAGIIFAEDTV